MIVVSVRFLLLVSLAASGCSLTTDLDHFGAGGASAATAGSGGAGGTPTTTSSSTSGSGGYRELVLRNNPIAYWRLGEATGEAVAIDETRMHDAQYIGIVMQGVPGAIAGDDDTAVGFDSAGGRGVQLADASALGFAGLAELSFELWISPDVIDEGYRRILSKESPVAQPKEGWYLTLHATEGLSWARVHNDSFEGLVADGPSLNEYHHVVGAFDGMEMFLYVDGEVASSGPSDNVLVETQTQFTIGAMADLNAGFSGRIDEVAIYDYALPGVVVVEHYAAGVMSR